MTETRQGSFLGNLVSQRKLNGAESKPEVHTTSLYYLIQDYKAGHLVFPPHQREKSWPDHKDEEYFYTLCTDNAPPGSFELYDLQLDNGKKSVRYLNDGSQRLRAAMRFLDECEIYGVSHSDAQWILRHTTYSCTISLHQSHMEALKRFQTVNNNLQLTSYQIVIGDIIYCEGQNKAKQWQEFIDTIHSTLRTQLTRIVNNPDPTPGTKLYLANLHRLYRHNLSMFLRYLEPSNVKEDFRTSVTLSIFDKSYFESRLARKLREMGYVKTMQKWKKFERIIDQDIALIDKCWIDTGLLKEGKYPNKTTVRWMLDLGLWRRANDYTTKSWHNFVFAVLNRIKGKTSLMWVDNENEPQRLNLSLSRLHEATTLQRIVNAELEKKPKRVAVSDSKQTKRPGWHDSHVLPVKTNGEGETFREPAGLNLERGAKPVTT